MSKVILLDVDGILADFVGGVLKVLNKHGFNRTEQDIKHLELSKSLTVAEMQLLDSEIHKSGWCSSLEWYSQSRTFVECLKMVGEVVVVTAPFQCHTWCHERMKWLEPLLPRSNVIFAGKKEFVEGDFLIEDSLANALDWTRNRPRHKKAILLNRPWNIVRSTNFNAPNILRANDYKEVIKLIMESK